MTAQPIRYRTDIEEFQPDERDTVDQLNETFDTILTKTAEDYGHAVRAVHAKAHAVWEGTLTVLSDLPPELAQGLFARPGDHKAYLRVSTNAGDLLPDAISLPRGLALKVVGADGPRLAGAEGDSQDFVMVNGPVFQAKTASQFLSSLKLLAKTTDRLEGAKEVLSTVMRGVNTALQAVGLESPTVNTLGGAPNANPLGETYYSVTPFRFGDYIAKFSIAPVSPALLALKGQIIDASGKPDAIREKVQADMLGIDAIWELRVQLCRDLDKQPIEDATVAWDEAISPFQTVAAIRIPRQDGLDKTRFTDVDDSMRFSIWTGLSAHQPLGNINRARKDTYKHSADFRANFNGCPIHEPS